MNDPASRHAQGFPTPGYVRLGRRIQRLLRRLSIHFIPFLMVRENERDMKAMPLPTGFAFRKYDAGDNLLLLRSRGREESNRTYLKRFEQGNCCYGLELEGRVVAVIWCDFDAITGLLYQKPLEPYSVYFFDVFSHPEYRGQNLAPALRQRVYAELEKDGIRHYRSITEYFNTPARRFKEKLGASNEWLGVYLRLFGRRGRFIVWRY